MVPPPAPTATRVAADRLNSTQGEEDYAETLERVQEEIQQTAGKTLGRPGGLVQCKGR